MLTYIIISCILYNVQAQIVIPACATSPTPLMKSMPIIASPRAIPCTTLPERATPFLEYTPVTKSCCPAPVTLTSPCLSSCAPILSINSYLSTPVSPLENPFLPTTSLISPSVNPFLPISPILPMENPFLPAASPVSPLTSPFLALPLSGVGTSGCCSKCQYLRKIPIPPPYI
ncbi:hypothetical protein K1T71_014246 [Dendrolimus kikuchii]|uniref:Uncharacterized protein n=1 Tax=Dendrolimus kikuchii TaxID=765133 RepID=A0ACC1CFG1_9NEOP|nr:hypothetical protein K1T71_014246 [Dendrolimus kikuchii]